MEKQSFLQRMLNRHADSMVEKAKKGELSQEEFKELVEKVKNDYGMDVPVFPVSDPAYSHYGVNLDGSKKIETFPHEHIFLHEAGHALDKEHIPFNGRNSETIIAKGLIDAAGGSFGGSALGAAAGAFVPNEEEDAWKGALVGAAAGGVVGAAPGLHKMWSGLGDVMKSENNANDFARRALIDKHNGDVAKADQELKDSPLMDSIKHYRMQDLIGKGSGVAASGGASLLGGGAAGAIALSERNARTQNKEATENMGLLEKMAALYEAETQDGRFEDGDDEELFRLHQQYGRSHDAFREQDRQYGEKLNEAAGRNGLGFIGGGLVGGALGTGAILGHQRVTKKTLPDAAMSALLGGGGLAGAVGGAALTNRYQNGDLESWKSEYLDPARRQYDDLSKRYDEQLRERGYIALIDKEASDMTGLLEKMAAQNEEELSPTASGLISGGLIGGVYGHILNEEKKVSPLANRAVPAQRQAVNELRDARVKEQEKVGPAFNKTQEWYGQMHGAIAEEAAKLDEAVASGQLSPEEADARKAQMNGVLQDRIQRFESYKQSFGDQQSVLKGNLENAMQRVSDARKMDKRLVPLGGAIGGAALGAGLGYGIDRMANKEASASAGLLEKMAFDYYKGVRDTEHGDQLRPGMDPMFDENVSKMQAERTRAGELQKEQLKAFAPRVLTGALGGGLAAAAAKRPDLLMAGASAGAGIGSLTSFGSKEMMERRKGILDSAERLKGMERQHEQDLFEGQALNNNVRLPSHYYRG